MDTTVFRIESGGELSGDLRGLLLIELEGILRALSEELQCLRSQSVLPFTETRVTYTVSETEGVHGGYLSQAVLHGRELREIMRDPRAKREWSNEFSGVVVVMVISNGIGGKYAFDVVVINVMQVANCLLDSSKRSARPQRSCALHINRVRNSQAECLEESKRERRDIKCI